MLNISYTKNIGFLFWHMNITWTEVKYIYILLSSPTKFRLWAQVKMFENSISFMQIVNGFSNWQENHLDIHDILITTLIPEILTTFNKGLDALDISIVIFNISSKAFACSI
ncbi:hypothetical protein PHYBLDRAFT_68592 [Phycomyces blakesleeanus NRRL 1555(-)]|uniref:Uncharacterized protein n=1 Tax=Phycomyces blakesleeanus (strain ATCC 8743b / DSM 1359 / FGSC 10004 / NBRC 33097 / NRRL 1555) TaxID=763407 RepID=A0A167PH38_PHYB8|nr:hypothetical protein PHYBLDRAFT_68592 [Phycomyces blakesleeanus NRRL 1555(-)]OAD77904.1 hypothetical protein PHYBLDRAFT_68592 [Phycomyces blakesleeanus NRRL 1555(-)]|eukprot:XP_018295944.1 hypothetical protein PHYBLDRAFT_68592 [Phycomyces blakesleeanus NRRL 1555(-)]